jgi:mono/diheme cytochrome c family protein/roadblock/LC7 domain-containing protein
MELRVNLPVFLLAAALAPAANAVTFSENIAPILYENCVTCHRPGQAAPFSLISYEDAKKRGALIAAVTKSRYMPPWHAEHGFGEFRDERRLSDAQIATVAEWVRQGMPEGDRKKMPKAPEFPDGWRLGRPDLILEMPAAFEVPADGPDIYRNFTIPTGLAENKWVRAVEFHPSARKAVHHALFAYVRAGSLKDLEAKDGKPGSVVLNGLGLGLGAQAGLGPSGGLGGWAVGGTPQFLPDEQALPLPKGTDLILQMHFHPTGKPETERASVGLYFAEKAPEKRLLQMSIPSLFGIGSGLDVAPGTANYTIQDSATLAADVQVLSAAAHAHYIGKEMKATATLPDGTTRPLLWIKNWDFNWQEQYLYKEPVRLPKGTRIDVSIRYDNSAANPRNPSHPPKRVLWGEQSFDEMGGVGFMMVAVRHEDEAALDQDEGARFKTAIGAALQNGTAARVLQNQQRARARLQQVAVFDRQGTILSRIGAPGLYSQPALSPDGTRIAAIKTERDSGNSGVWVFDISTGKATPVTSGVEQNSSPVWSPDGKQIAYVSASSTGNISSLYRKASDGSGAEELIYRHTPGAAAVITDWSADGRLCFWAGDVMYELALNGDGIDKGMLRKPRELFRGNFTVRAGRYSPDGRRMAYSSNQPGRFEMFVGDLQASGMPVQISKEGALGGNFWRGDGKELFYLTLPGFAVMAVDINVDIDGSAEFHPGIPKNVVSSSRRS